MKNRKLMYTGNCCVIQCQSFGGGIIRNRTGNAFAGNVAGIGIGNLHATNPKVILHQILPNSCYRGVGRNGDLVTGLLFFAAYAPGLKGLVGRSGEAAFGQCVYRLKSTKYQKF